MSVRTSQRRRSERIEHTRPALLTSLDGAFSTLGHITNVSENGMFFITQDTPGLPREGPVTIAPGASDGADQGAQGGIDCRIVRVRAMGHMIGLGLEHI